MAAIQLLTAVVLNFMQFWKTRGQGVNLTLNSMTLENNSIVAMRDIGNDSEALVCSTSYTPCCTSANNETQWYFPNGSQVLNNPALPYQRNRRQFPGRVLLNRNSESTIMGIFHCDVPDANDILQSLYVGIYTSTTGKPTAHMLVYNDTTRSFTCTSTGGPATNVTWTKDGGVITLNATYQQTQMVTDTTTGTYENVLTIAESASEIFGIYGCTVENIRGTTYATIDATVPSISVHSSGQPVVGENYSLVCSIARTDPFNFTSITYQWFNESSESWAHVENQTNLTFNPLQLYHAGEYTCVVTLTYLTGNLSLNTSQDVRVQNSTLQLPPAVNGSPPVGAIVGAILVVVVVCGITIGIITIIIWGY